MDLAEYLTFLLVIAVSLGWASLLRWLLDTEKWVWAIVAAAPYLYLLTLTD